MQINSVTNLFNLPTSGALRNNDALQQSSSVVETSSPVSIQADAGRRVASVSETEAPKASKSATLQSDAELAIIRELASRDREVRRHEMAHQSVGGPYTGSVTYTFQRGPDGVMYAVGGEVSIDTSPVAGDPEATLQKAQTIERAALAPADPSPQDYKVAAMARSMANEARADIVAERRESEQEDEPSEISALDSQTSDDRQAVEQSSEAPPLNMGVIEDKPNETEVSDAARTDLDALEQSRKERREKIEEEMQQRRERRIEAMKEFARELSEIQARFAELNKRLVETGAIQGGNPLGGLLDNQA